MSRGRTARLADLVRFVGGGTPTRNNPDYYGGEIPWVTPKDMKSWDIDSAQVNITEAGLAGSAARIVPAGSVLVVVRSGVLKHTLPVGVSRVPVAINQDIKAVLCGSEVYPDYLARLLKASSSLILSWVRATTADNLPVEKLKDMRILLPSIEEQRRIAEVLDRADRLHAKRREALAHLDELGQSIFVDMFGNPAVNPKSWPVAPLATLFDRPPIYGTMIPASSTIGGWLCLRVANIQEWALDLSDRKYVDLEDRALERHVVRNGDVLLARAIASQEHLGKAIVARPGSDRWAFDSHLMRLSFDARRADPEYIRALFMSPGGRSLFLRVTRRSSVQYNINTKEISALRLPVPPLVRQKEFAHRIHAIDDIRTAHRTHLAELDALFGSLQDRAFRGLL
ncbi:restriction endonuclease subunit S [Micromonospora rifamycinica]|uniref:restriction endonuclease subunit S n=1 Tax=Micromonospora rifamycinica TaxID=291594 RepID=UPI0033E276E0